jgi:hypothetical protein
MTDEMEYMRISQYCLNLIRNNLKTFFENKYRNIIEEAYKSSKSSSDTFYDVMFYFAFLKNNINEIKEVPRIIINTVHSIKFFRNKIAHQIPITLREFYRFVDDTQIIIESLNICDKNEINKIENTRKEIIKRMNVSDDNLIIIGTNYNAGNNCNNNLNINNLNMINYNKIGSDSDIEMGDYDEECFNGQNIINENNNFNGINYNNFNEMLLNKKNNISKINEKKIINDDEKERQKKIELNYEKIMKNNDKDNFMPVKKIDF